jgi:O-antigen ligase
MLTSQSFKTNDFAGLMFSLLPMTLFLPVGFMYFWIALVFIAATMAGNFQDIKTSIANNPIFFPTALLVIFVVFQSLFLSGENDRRWSGIIYYFIFVFFFFFSAAAPAHYFAKAKKIFYLSAVLASAVFYLSRLGALPEWYVFKNFFTYAGNRSIAIGIFLAIAAGWLLNDAGKETRFRQKSILVAGYIFISSAIFIFAVTRTGLLLLFVLSAMAIARHLKHNKINIAVAAMVVIFFAVMMNTNSTSNQRLSQTLSAVTAPGPKKADNGDMVRLQFFEKTGQMILEKPLLGHGVGSWRQQYPIRAEGLLTSNMSTPHNDYLLFAAELGLCGLLILLAIFFNLARTAVSSTVGDGMPLLMMTVALAIGSMFNAILRDWRFGVPFMLLLAIAYRGSLRDSHDT